MDDEKYNKPKFRFDKGNARLGDFEDEDKKDEEDDS